MAHRLLYDPDNDGWERSDFPIVCETCLGPNPYVRMQRMEFGGTCHISGRPYTVFRWRPGNEARYKKTIVCQEVAKAKNVCQVCLLDLDYGLPVQVRDTALGLGDDDLPESEVGKEYALNEREKAGDLGSSFSQQRPNDTILQLQRTTPYYKRNRAQICSFFVKGTCNRGAECPYRHEMPAGGELAEQNIKDRYYGVNDPVANKMLRRVNDLPQLTTPEDQSITTLYVGSLVPEISEGDVRDAFYSHGEIASVRRVDSRNCAFITFTTRAAAERAAEALHNKLIIKGVRCRVDWGKPQTQGGASTSAAAARIPPGDPSTSGAPSMLPPQVAAQIPGGTTPFPPSGPNYFNLPPSGAAAPAAYPSMDPSAMGTSSRAASGRGAGPPGPDGAGDRDGKRPRIAPDVGGGLPPPVPMPHGGPPRGPPGGPPPPLGPPPPHMPPPPTWAWARPPPWAPGPPWARPLACPPCRWARLPACRPPGAPWAVRRGRRPACRRPSRLPCRRAALRLGGAKGGGVGGGFGCGVAVGGGGAGVGVHVGPC